MVLSKFFLCASFIIVFRGLWSFVSFRKHLLNTLLSLEFIILGIFFLISSCFLGLNIEVYFILFFLALAVCEGSLGLSLLVSIVRTHGNDYFRRFRSLQMLKFILILVILFFIKDWALVQTGLFFLSFVVALFCGHDFFYYNSGFILGMDYLRYILILLRF